MSRPLLCFPAGVLFKAGRHAAYDLARMDQLVADSKAQSARFANEADRAS